MEQADRNVIVNARVATMAVPGDGDILESGAVVMSKGRIQWLGDTATYEASIASTGDVIIDAKGRLTTPGFIDCHTHLVYGGDRAAEFEARLNGKSYAEIAAAGGGILATVMATRDASEETLYRCASERLEVMRSSGITTIEIKSGYGLDTENELKMLRVADRIGNEQQISVLRTFLGAHALPPEYRQDADAYIDLVCREMLPAAAGDGLVDAVDVFCEHIAFDLDQTRRVFDAARALNLPVKVHSEQLSLTGGTRLAAEHGALSADHLEYADQAAVRDMASSGMVAVMLPGAFYYLNETRKPPVDLLRRHGVPMAVATDANPGSSPVLSLLAAMNMGCVLFGLTPLEVLAGVTVNAAKALGIDARCGSIAAGKRADLAIWNAESARDLCYSLGAAPCETVFRAGEIVYSS